MRAKRSAHPAFSSYQVEMGGLLPDSFRAARGTPIIELVPIGTIVATSYKSGPYVVVGTAGPYILDYAGEDCPHWTLLLIDHPQRARRSLAADHWINEVVPVDGRLLKLFGCNPDEVFVTGFDAETARALQPKPMQLDLFGLAAGTLA